MTKVKAKKTKKLQISFNTKMSEYEKAYDVKLSLTKDIRFGDYLVQQGFPSLAAMLKES